MTDFKANAPNSIFGELSVSPDPLAEFGAASWQGEGLGWGRGGKGEVEGREREVPQVTVEPWPLRALQRHWCVCFFHSVFVFFFSCLCIHVFIMPCTIVAYAIDDRS